MVMPWNEEYEPLSDPDALGDFIRTALLEAGIAPAPAVVSLPRQSTMIRVVDISSVDEADVPGAIALQVEALEHSLNRDLSYDFVVHHGSSLQSRFATLVTCPKTVTDAITSALRTAGIEAQNCCLGELSLACRDPEPTAESSVFVLAGDVKLDVVLVHNQVPTAAVSTRMPEDPDQAAAQVNSLRDRLLASLPAELGITALTRVVVFGTGSLSLASSLQQHSDLSVNVGKGAADNDVLVQAVAHGRLTPDGQPDLLHPKLPPDPKQERRKRLVRRALPVVVVLLLAGGGLVLWYQSLAADHRTITTRVENSRKFLEVAEPTILRWKFLMQWQETKVDISRQLIRLLHHFPDQQRVYLTRLQMEHLPGNAAAVLRLDGVAKENSDVMALNHHLLSDSYDLKPHGIEPSVRDSHFKSQFQIESSLPNHDEE